MGVQLWPSQEDLPEFKALVLDYTERMYVQVKLRSLQRRLVLNIKGRHHRKVVGQAFMRAIADTLGHQEVFAELQRDPYW